MKFKDELTLEGHFRIEVLDKEGNVIDFYEDPNMIMNGAKAAVLQLLEAYDSGKTINSIALGDGGYDNTTGTLKTIDPSETGLYNEYYEKSGFDSITTPNTQPWAKVYEMIFTTEEANGESGLAKSFNEAGLFMLDGSIFAKKVFPPKIKTVDNALRIVWIINVSSKNRYYTRVLS